MGWSTFFRHLKALNKKNLIIFKRNKRAVICEILIPILLIGIISLTAVQLPKAEDKPREYLYENNGKYLGPRGERSYFDLRLLGNSTDTDTRVAIVGKNETYGKDLLVSIMQDNNVMYDARFDSLSDVRSYISKSDNHRKSGISYVLKLDVDDEKKDFELTTLKSDFDNTFSPFNLDQRTPNYYYYDKYVGWSNNDFDYNYIGNVAQLIAEKVGEEKTGTPLKIHAGYAQKSSQPYKDTILPDVMDQMYPIFIVIIYTLPYMYFLQRAVEEKQTKTRESMRMMGMVDSAYWASWFILFCCQVLLTSIILTVGSIFTLFPG